MISVGICDDSEKTRAQITFFLRDYFQTNASIQIWEYSSGEDFLKKQEEINILFLDIELPGMSGIKVKNKLFVREEEIIIIFITSHVEFMPEAYGKNVYGFIKKPLQYTDFYQKMNEIVRLVQQRKEKIATVGLRKHKKIEMADIIYIEAQGKYSKVYIRNEIQPFMDERNLGTWIDILENDFVQVHKSYLVNLSMISNIVKYVIILDKGETIPLSRRRAGSVRKYWKEYIIEHACFGG